MMDIDPPSPDNLLPSNKKFYIAVDYGTTYFAVSFVSLEPGEDPEKVKPDRIKNITNYPKDPRVYGHIAKEVPTELCYLNPSEQ